MPIQVRVLDSREKPWYADLSTGSAAPSDIKLIKQTSFTLAGGNANAIAGYWQNPESVQIMVLHIMANITTAGGTIGGDLDFGTAANATTGSDNLINDADANTVVVYTNTVDGGVAGKGAQIMDEMDGATDYITCQILLQNETSLVGTVYVWYALLA